MREILFRGYSTVQRKWFYGDLIHAPDVNSPHIANNDSFVKVKKSTIGQYTGLTDNNGKKIFEGDILNMHGGCAEMDEREYDIQVIVRYGRTGYGSEIGFSGFRERGFRIPLMCEGALTVIGNIHDNPELLKGGEG